MTAALAQVKEEWKHFKHDAPGERFRNHHRRMQTKSRSHAAVSLALGVLLLAGGVVFLFIPGPGLPLIVFGIALVASHSRRLSSMLDRAEPRMRDRGHRAASWWRARSRAQKAGLVTAAILVASAGLMAIWKWVVAAYLL